MMDSIAVVMSFITCVGWRWASLAYAVFVPCLNVAVAVAAAEATVMARMCWYSDVSMNGSCESMLDYHDI